MCFIAAPEFISSGRGESKRATYRARNHQFAAQQLHLVEPNRMATRSHANDTNRGPARVRGNRPRGLRIVRLIQHLRPGLDANPVFLMRFGNGSKVLAQMVVIPDSETTNGVNTP